MSRLLNLLTNLFPIWVLLGGTLALVQPGWFTWFRGPAIVWGLAVIMLDTVQIVLLPVLLGLVLHHLFPRLVKAVLPVAPLVSVITIALIVTSIVGQNAGAIKT
jgi:predicted Na+-dependent transporter